MPPPTMTTFDFASSKSAPLRHVHPGALFAAGEFGLEDVQLPQAVLELRIFGRRRGVFDRAVETAEDLFERVVVALAVAAGKVGVTARGLLHQRRVFDHDLIRRVAIAD